MNENKEKEVLWESGAVSNADWKTFYFEVTPSMATNYLVLEAYYVELPKYCGNILIDNIKYYPNGHFELIPEPKDTLPIVLKEEPDTIPTQINGRKINQAAELTFKGDKITITVWDNRTTDGDIISLFLNNKNILKEFTISKNRLTFEVELTGSDEYYLTLYAHNLGSIPPNTVALYISDGERKTMITLSSDLKACGSVKIKIEQEFAEK